MDYFNDPFPEKCVQIFEHLRDRMEAFAMEKTSVSIIFDDLEPMKWQYGRSQMMALLRGCKAFTFEKHVFVLLSSREASFVTKYCRVLRTFMCSVIPIQIPSLRRRHLYVIA